MRTTLKHAVLVTVSLLLVSAGAFVYPLMQDPFERRSLDACNATELDCGFYLEYDLPNNPYELSSASLFVHSGNKTVAAHYLHDGERERLASGEPFETVVVSGNLSDPEERSTGWCYLSMQPMLLRILMVPEELHLWWK